MIYLVKVTDMNFNRHIEVIEEVYDGYEFVTEIVTSTLKIDKHIEESMSTFLRTEMDTNYYLFNPKGISTLHNLGGRGVLEEMIKEEFFKWKRNKVINDI